MSYPWIVDPDFPLVDYITDKDGTHYVVFRDESHYQQDGTITYATVKADVVLAVAFKMSVDHVDTEWAKHHLERNGYRVEKRTAASYGRLADWARFLGMGK